MNLSGKVVLVTGASRGIGAAIAKGFAAQGASLGINYFSRHEAAQQVVQACRELGGDAQTLQCDVTIPEQAQALVERVVKAFGRLDVLVNNALAPYSFNPEQRASFDDLHWSDYQAQLQSSVGAAFHLSRAALPYLRVRAQGAIVNIVSDLVEDPVVPYHDYVTAKSALVGFSRQLAAELGPQGVRVNCVAPGLVYPTEASASTKASFRDSLMATTPLRRLAKPEDVAGPVVFLASDMSAFMTGQVLFVNGGRVMR